ncbi:ankyrin repeat domain-containing protein [Sphingosinicella sp. LHD-64]|uniref:ankyrin repeat domain-containing protein n=1 Tax=Sphingosinicella sp. LHD-64 TaxID=3072139 RepID=UPI00280C4252|nr:ankyrin repeat domain-containing protein [Sphingosinicella sp. LHD-64]MDQ8756206.1 ankyrin repeat domain-containing protein [Sphingosinicella sp. LHD-64]
MIRRFRRNGIFAAARSGDVERLRDMLRRDPMLVRARDAAGATALHLAIASPPAVRLLLEFGAEPNARDESDNALPLHYAASGGNLETVRALLDAGSDVQGEGDIHALEVIGWATCFDEPRREIVDLLVARGAGHHVFSAIALADPELLREVVAHDPGTLQRRLAPSEQEQTALHYVIAPPDGLVGGRFRTGGHYDLLELLIELGADPNAADAKGRTPLVLATLRGDRQAMRILHDAGVRLPPPPETPAEAPSSFGASVGPVTPMLAATDMDTTLAWYRALGFELAGSHGGVGRIDWAFLRFGEAEIMISAVDPGGADAPSPMSLWIRTERIDDLYALLRRRQLECGQAFLAGRSDERPDIAFAQDLHTAFYGQREFCVRDPDGVAINFYQPIP